MNYRPASMWDSALCLRHLLFSCRIAVGTLFGSWKADKFFIFLLTLFMTSITAATITYVFSSVARVTTVATLLSAMTFVLSIVGLI